LFFNLENNFYRKLYEPQHDFPIFEKMKVLRILILLTVFLAIERIPISAQTFPSPELVSVTTLANGDVELTWVSPTITCGPFIGFDIYRSPSFPWPYVLLAIIASQGQETYTDVGANGDSICWYYYMVGDYACSGYTFLTSDTLSNSDSCEVNLINLPSSDLSEILIAPNPITTSLTVYLPNEFAEGEIQIKNYLGQPILNQNQIGGSKMTVIELSSIPAGLYFLKFESSGRSMLRKFVKN